MKQFGEKKCQEIVWVIYCKKQCIRTVKPNWLREMVGWIFWEEILNENEVLEDWQLLKWTILKTESQKILL